MTKDLMQSVNAETGEIIVRELTNDEQVIRDAEKAAWLAEKEQEKLEAEAKATAKVALLERLGITEDEAKLLFA
jgi:antitoxin component of MazEF toxin-antitoxin module